MPSEVGDSGRRSIALVAPIRPGSTSGNSVTARRWHDQLVELGHVVRVIEVDNDATVDDLDPATDCDLVIALHARRCAGAATAAKRTQPDRPVIVALAGTDLYGDLPAHVAARHAVRLADRLLVLQDDGVTHLESMDPAWAAKAHVVHQSVARSELAHAPTPDAFRVVVLSHLRDVKDPLLAAQAARQLPHSSTVTVLHAGSAYSPEWARQARHEDETNPRYKWLGPVDRSAASQLLASASVLACTSLLEGGANVVSEAIALGVPVVGTDIGGNRGLLGADHPGLVPVRNSAALAELISDLEQDPARLAVLRQRSIDRQWMTEPAHERNQWRRLLDGVPS